MNKLEISEVQIVPIKPIDGLVGFSSCLIGNQFYIGNIAIYTSPTASLGYRLVFPTKKLANGRHVDIFYPISKEFEQLVTKAIINKYLELMTHFHNIEAI